MTNLIRSNIACLLVVSGLIAHSVFGVPPQSPTNQKLLEAVEPFEALAESALTDNQKKIDQAFGNALKVRTATRALLPAVRGTAYDSLFDSLQTAHSKNDNIALSLQAAELYRLLVSSLDSATLTVPMEVSLLDYSGFRTNALIKATPVDWTAISATAAEANAWWAKVRDRVTDKKLQGSMDKAQQGLSAAAKTRDSALLRSSTKEDLDLVDDIEKFFAAKKK